MIPKEFPIQVTRDYFEHYKKGVMGWHWHREIEFAVVLSGSAEFYINESVIVLQSGEGVFINGESLHCATIHEEGVDTILFTISFPPDAIAPQDSFLYQNYVMPFLEEKTLGGFSLHPDCAWHKTILAKLNSIYALTSHPGFALEMQLQLLVTEIWFQLLLQKEKLQENAALSLEKKKIEKRVKTMLRFIEEHYQENLSVEEIAGSAGVSKTECFRCFQNIVHKKPITYVNEYRIERAMELLAKTSMSVAQICHACGFHHESYFGKWFRKATGITPLQYRKQL